VDIESPSISFLYESTSMNPLFHGSQDSIILYSNAYDDLSGLQEIEFCFGSSSGSCDIYNWADGVSIQEEIFITIQNLNLENSIQYFGTVRVTDLAGNISSLSGDGIIIDIQGPSVNSVIDVLNTQDLTDISLTNSLNTLSFRILDPIDELSGIGWYEYSIGSNPGQFDVKNWTLINQTFYVDDQLQLQHAEKYFISIKVYDNMGNSSVVYSTNGIEIDEYIGPPFFENIDLISGSVISNSFDTEIKLLISEPVQEDFEVNLTSQLLDNYNYNYDYDNSSNMIIIRIIAPLTALDTVYLSIYDLKDLLGFNSDTTNLNYVVPMVGDLNFDNQIDLIDLNIFSVGWQNGDLSKELGPVSGEIPFFKPQLDNQLDLRDIMSFTRMWNWSNQISENTEIVLNNAGDELSFEQIDKALYFTIPEKTTAARITIDYPDQGNASFLDLYNLDKIEIINDDKELRKITINKGIIDTLSKRKIAFQYSSELRKNISLSFNYIFYNKDNDVVSSGKDNAIYTVIPDNWKLHQNYPNPFNPLTNIDIDIPKDGVVRMVIYDVMGRLVKTLIDGEVKAGFKNIKWDGLNSYGDNVSAGIYFCHLSSVSYRKTIKLVLLK